MQTLYPSIKPYKDYYIPVSDGYQLYVEECGNPEGIALIYMHGGPGSGFTPYHRRLFDPDIYRIILFDQRGAGRSIPHVGLDNNTTQALIDDIEQIRDYCQLSRWIVFGSSWGATLALLYAEAYPERVRALLLSSLFLARPKDIDWFIQMGIPNVYPDYWRQFLALLTPEEQTDPIKASYQRLLGDDELVRMATAKAWSTLQAKCASFEPNQYMLAHCQQPFEATSFATIQCHYMVNRYFLAPNHILKHIHTIKDIPGIIVHGRYDMLCPLENAWVLHKAWPTSQLTIVRNAAHTAADPALTGAIIYATQEMAKIFAD